LFYFVSIRSTYRNWFFVDTRTWGEIHSIKNKIHRIPLNASWFTRSTEIHRETYKPAKKNFIIILRLNFHSRLPLATRAPFYNIGQTSNHPRLKPPLSQDTQEKCKANLSWSNKVLYLFVSTKSTGPRNGFYKFRLIHVLQCFLFGFIRIVISYQLISNRSLSKMSQGQLCIKQHSRLNSWELWNLLTAHC
jgi:hypothetical protein